jgi:quercetin dioxygenase-like cupin family protein
MSAAPDVIRMGGVEIRFLQSGGGLDLFEMLVQPAARMPVAHYHTDWNETIYGLSGISVWRVDGQDVALAAGESVLIGRGVVHGFRNDTDAPARCLCMLTPGKLGPAYFQEMAALVAAGHADPERMKATMLRYGLVPVTDA